MSDPSPHFCPLCRCRFPDIPPQLLSTVNGKSVWWGMLDNYERLVEELVAAKQEIQRLKNERSSPAS